MLWYKEQWIRFVVELYLRKLLYVNDVIMLAENVESLCEKRVLQVKKYFRLLTLL